MSDGYFAAKPAEETAGVLLQRANTFFTNLYSNTYLEKIRKMWQAYYGVYNESGHEVTFSGEQEELVDVPVNHFRNLAQHILVMITANRPNMEAKAVNSDYKSLSQTYLANGILEYYMRQKGLEDCIRKAAEMAVVLGSSFIKLSWNATGGEIFDADEDTGKFDFEGDVEFNTLSPLDVVVDGTKESWNNEWVLVRTYVNKYNLSAKFPELKDRIENLQTKSERNMSRLAFFSNDDTDDVAVYEFYHRPTEALPEGRYILFADTNCVLMDTKMPYKRIPIFRIAASDIMGTPYGYSPMFDIYPIQECINTLFSTIMTNQSAFGVQNVYVPAGADISVAEMEGGMNIIQASAKPEALNLTKTPEEVFKFLETMVQTAETVSGVNSVSRGNPPPSLQSGTALALVQSMSIQFINGLQQSYVKLIEDVGTSLIDILKEFATAPKIISIVGKNQRAYLKEFTGEDLSQISRVIVDVGNPLSRTTAGRVEMASQMLQMKLIQNPQQYFQVINTGRLETMFEGEMSELLLIKSENERLMDGEMPMSTHLDQHSLHIMEHRSVLADPDLRKDPQLVAQVLEHIQTHVEFLRTVDPQLLGMLGQQALQGAPPPGPGAPPPGGPQPPMAALEGNSMPNMMAAGAGQMAPPPMEQGPGGMAPPGLPPIPQPPGDFANNPVLAADALAPLQ